MNRSDRRPSFIPLHESFDGFIRRLRERYPEFFEKFGFEEIEVPYEALLKEPYKPYKNERIGEEFAREIEEAIAKYGFEAIAFYVPYHFTDRWGIYIINERLNGLAYLISMRSRIPFDRAFTSCERAVLSHETFHFHTEYSATIAETILRKRMYIHYRDKYRPYNKDEEAIANAWMLSSRSRIIGRIRPELMDLCDISPLGYKDYRKYMRRGYVDYDKVREFWSQELLGKPGLAAFPVRIEMGMRDVLPLTPILYVNVMKAPEAPYTLSFLSANYRIEDTVKKLKRILPEDIVDASVHGFTLKSGAKIPIHYHPRKSGALVNRLINEVADALGRDRKWLKERVWMDP